MIKNKLKLPYFNKVIDKLQLKYLITWTFRNYGIARASNMVDKLKDLGFNYATKAGISLSLEDLRIPPSKHYLLEDTIKIIDDTDNRYKRGEITAVERFQKVIDTWNYASENLKKQVIKYFKDTDPLNSIYMMAFSGARANISQVRQLVGMRGLMADPQGQIIDLPIANNFREGLTITDYFISSYGARKGLVDTALRTADSGYLTRRLVDVAQDVIVREYDCKTSKGILISEMTSNQKTLVSLKQTLLGRVLVEDIWDIDRKICVAKANQIIDTFILEKLIIFNLYNILVRSPLTCSSNKSVCQLCYGWNLAHGKMVDLGEAIGIIAAQSIGEPGTQLTMRTFHTGGVFTGELDQIITSTYDGIIEYSKNIQFSDTRTKHGDHALIINNDSYIDIVDKEFIKHRIEIIKGSLLFVNNLDKIKQGQLLLQYESKNRLIKEKAQKSIVADFAGSIHINNILNNLNIKKNYSITDNVIIWVLSGQVYNIPSHTNLLVTNNQIIKENSLIARTELVSKHKGLVHLIKNINGTLSKKILLITSSKLLTNCCVFINNNQDYKNYILEIDGKEKFILKNIFNRKIVNNSIIADLISNAYKTKTGGIVKYLDLSIVKSKLEDNEKNIYDVYGSGYILWISEETHILNKDLSLLLVAHGEFIEAGTEIIQNIFASNSGILEVVEKDGIVREIVIKPGKFYELNHEDNIYHKSGKNRGFLRPGEEIIKGQKIDKLAYWEYINIQEESFILMRPVTVYAVPSKSLKFEVSANSFETSMTSLNLIRRTSFRDGERVKSVSGVNLITTHLMLQIEQQALDLKCSIQLEKANNNLSYFYLKFITSDLLYIKDSYFMQHENLYTQTSLLIKDKEFINKNSIIAQTDIFSAIHGKITHIQNIKSTSRRILIVGDSNTITFNFDNINDVLVNINTWVYAGDYITKLIKTPESGQVIEINDNKIVVRIGQPYLISSGSFLHVNAYSLVQRGENIATLIYERSKTGDIIQGLPRIEEILEARKKTDNSFNPHLILEAKFKYYLSRGLKLYDATRQSFLDIQLFLVKEIQTVYQSQGVDIADKHIEVIVRQMTAKVKIENGGATSYLPGEIIELKKVELINKSLRIMEKLEASYSPILLGITKASLNTDSFISAASFQETTKVLTEAAISGKLDWLRGLKENVIIGRLIPAGTGFNLYNNSRMNQDTSQSLDNETYYSNDLYSSTSSSFEDIIVDDRNARTYQA
uniref:DNA-directed RNA polymerase n=1 Tax=Ptilothamnion sphaericum TaxID=1498216 RepID=A0A4D6X009_9FLOR|nr:RNA polymerase b'-subunit [Ptilothamnion sphaericum]